MNSPAIEEKLKKSDCNIDELLDEEEIIQEMKNQNAKLLNLYLINLTFSFDKQNVKLLLDYIISEPVNDDHKKGHKFPFIASEILNCDVNKINEFFTATEAELLAKDRKCSSVSNADSDMVLSQDDHLNAFSNEERSKFEKKTEIHIENNTEVVVADQEEGDNHNNNENNEEGVNYNINNNNNDIHDNNDNMPHADLSPIEITSPDIGSPNNLNNKSISDLINVQNLEETSQTHNEAGEKNRNRIELLDHLFSFLETDQDLNYVLVGYFSKFLNLLLNKFPQKIISYIYNERPEILQRLIRHSDKKSISEIVPKVLLIESYLNYDKDKPITSISGDRSNTSNAFLNLNSSFNLNLDTILATRKAVLCSLFKKLRVLEDDAEKTSNIANILIEVIENKNVLEIILSEKSILEHLTNLLSINLNEKTDDSNFEINYNYNEVLNVFINILRFTQVENLKFPTYKNEGTEDIVNSENGVALIENTLLGECVLNCLDKILKNFLPSSSYNKSDESKSDVTVETTTETEPNINSQLVYMVEGTFGNAFKPLCSKRVRLVEFVYYLLNYFKNVQSVLDKILIHSEFLKYLIQYFFQYEWNNIYQLNFENFLKSYLNNINNHPEITRYLFDNLKLLNVLMEHGVPCSTNSNEVTDAGFTFNSTRKINHGYFAVLIELCYKISQVEICNTSFKNNYSTPEWEIFVKEKVLFWRKMFDRKLCLPEAPHSTSIDDMTHITGHTEESQKEEGKRDEEEGGDNHNKYEEGNPFQRDEYFFNMGTENEDWFNPKKNDDNFNADSMLEDINSFEFVEERNFVKRKHSQEETLLKEKE